MEHTAAIILAAGKGKRMKSELPKVLHRVMGKTLIRFPAELALRLGCSDVVVVVGHGRERVEADVAKMNGAGKVRFALQEQQLGTGHAVMCALSKLKGHNGPVLVLSGDVPLLDKPAITRLKNAFKKGGGKAAFLSFVPQSPAGYGRVIRDGGNVVAIREHRDCSKRERTIGEVNSGIYLIDAGFLRRSIKTLRSDNDQGEIYLTDLVSEAAQSGIVPAIAVPPDTVHGVNDRADLAEVEAILSARTNLVLMRAGVTLQCPETIRVELGVKVGPDSVIGGGVFLCGKTTVGRGCRIDVGAVVSDSEIRDGAHIKPYSVIEDSVVGVDAQIGPMGRLRPGTRIERGAKVGNFVEIKNTVLGPGSKASHLAYLGDGVIGRDVNIGAGTIFCNYDGFQKHKTVLEDEVFIGSDSQLVAPVTVGKGAYVASGSTVTHDVPEDALAIARAKQENKKGVAAVLKRRLKSLKEKAMAKKREGK